MPSRLLSWVSMTWAGFAAVALVALLIPLLLIVVTWQPPLEVWRRVLIEWMFMADPQLWMVIVAAVAPTARRSAWLFLLVLTVLLFGFHAVELARIVGPDHGFAWIFYWPVAIVALLMLAAGRFFWSIRSRD